MGNFLYGVSRWGALAGWMGGAPRARGRNCTRARAALRLQGMYFFDCWRVYPAVLKIKPNRKYLFINLSLKVDLSLNICSGSKRFQQAKLTARHTEASCTLIGLNYSLFWLQTFNKQFHSFEKRCESYAVILTLVNEILNYPTIRQIVSKEK